MNDPRVYQDPARIQARVASLEVRHEAMERKIRDLEQMGARLRDLERNLEDFGIKLRSVQEGSGSF